MQYLWPPDTELFIIILISFTFKRTLCCAGWICLHHSLFVYTCIYYHVFVLHFYFYSNVWKMDIVLSWHHYINIATNLSLRLINHYLFINILIDTMRTYCTYYIVYNGDDCIPVYMHLNAHAAHHRHRRILHE